MGNVSVEWSMRGCDGKASCMHTPVLDCLRATALNAIHHDGPVAQQRRDKKWSSLCKMHPRKNQQQDKSSWHHNALCMHGVREWYSLNTGVVYHGSRK